jgi:hypothetical protein
MKIISSSTLWQISHDHRRWFVSLTPWAWLIIVVVVIGFVLTVSVGPSVLSSVDKALKAGRPTIYQHNGEDRQAVDGQGNPMRIKDARMAHPYIIPAGDIPYRE